MDQSESQTELSSEDTLDPHCANCHAQMEKAEDFGTNSDGSRNEEYCCRCMQGGTLM